MAKDKKNENNQVFHSFCPACFSYCLIADESGSKCYLYEKENFSVSDIVKAHLSYELSVSDYEIKKYGGEYPNYNCHYCCEDLSFLPETKDSRDKYICAFCFERSMLSSLTRYFLCSEYFSPSSDDAGSVCSSCFTERVNACD